MKSFVFLCLSIFLTSCIATHSNKASYTQAKREHLLLKAKSGDAEAQYQLGNSWCCGENGNFFSTKEATGWWCKAAKQGHAGAKKAVLNLAFECKSSKY